ncbi:MAG: hypothetical protein JWO96_615 [Candidatus Saccharibacteria bacterium]|nr:hypothetical protein [Candidatus Saccharibacteria bacterium]
MSEIYRPRAEAELATLENVQSSLADWEHNPIGGERHIAYIGEAAAKLIECYKPFRDSIELFIEARRDPDTYYRTHDSPRIKRRAHRPPTKEFAANLIRCGIQYNLLNLPGGRRFPDGFHSANDVEEEIKRWYEEEPDDPNEFSKADIFENNILRHFINTNIPQRYVGVMIAKYIYGDEFPDEVFSADIGCSQGEGWAQIAANLPFDEIGIYSRDEATGLLVPDKQQTMVINHEINKPLNVGYSLGVDLTQPRDAETANWALSNRRPSELMDRRLMNKDYYLSTVSLPNLAFHLGDATDSAEVVDIQRAIAKNWPDKPQKPNLITDFTVLYESSDEEVGVMLQNEAELLAKNGVILLQEPMEIDLSAPNGLRMYDDFRIPGIYKLIAYWPHQKDRGFEHLATYDSGRCKTAIINTELKALYSRN